MKPEELPIWNKTVADVKVSKTLFRDAVHCNIQMYCTY